MSRIPTIFGISMVSRERRRWLVVLCYAALSLLILLGFAASSDAARFILMIFAVFAGICIQFVIFYKLAKDTVLPMQGANLGLSLNTLWHKSGPDERQVAVRNAAYYRAYRVVAVYLLLIMPVASWMVTGEAALNDVLLEFFALSLFVLVYTLPQAIILWTEPDIPEEAI
jgi:FtsH-binding integral membrane protein